MTPSEGGPSAEEQAMLGTDLEIPARRELAIRATDAIAEVLEADVTVAALMRLAEAEGPDGLRFKRALRCVESVVRADSAVVQAVGETGVYHYVEGVIDYGANETTYLGLMEAFKLTAEETTGMYALREAIAEETNGTRPGFPTLYKALRHIGISPQQAVHDPEGTIAALSAAGCFVDHISSVTFDRPIFLPQGDDHMPPLGKNIDTLYETESTAWLRDFAENLHDEEKEN